jgi:predicted RNase H-like nuclease
VRWSAPEALPATTLDYEWVLANCEGRSPPDEHCRSVARMYSSGVYKSGNRERPSLPRESTRPLARQRDGRALAEPDTERGEALLGVTLIHEMRKRDAEKGLATLCVGFGQGAAVTLTR